MKIFTSRQQVREIIDSLKKFKEAGIEPPEQLVENIKKSLENAYRGVIIEFWTQLAKELPEFLPVFTTTKKEE